MTRRKVETTGLMNERDFPHVVELALPPGGFRSRSSKFEAFHRELGIPIRHGRGRHKAEQFYVRFCFPHATAADAFRDRFGGERLRYTLQKPRPRALKLKPKRIYAPRIISDHIMLQEDFERLHKFLLETEGLPEVSDDMRELVEDEWPELVHKLPPKVPTRR
jgi:hypothetical protein